MQPHQQRVLDEVRDLTAKRDRLAEFINAPAPSTFKSLDEAERKRLFRQLSAMNEYVRILDERIAAFV